MNTNPSLEILQRNFQLKDRVEHNSLVYFLIDYIRRNNRIMFIFKWLNALIFVGSAVFYLVYLYNQMATNMSMLAWYCAGLLLSFFSVPFHEAIHGVGFLLTGATKISFKAQWKKMMFMACAHHHVLNKRQFFLVAFLPCIFFLILGLVVLFMYSVNAIVVFITLGFLQAHTFFCIGDFAVCGYFLEQYPLEILTYDDMEENATYFYAKDKV